MKIITDTATLIIYDPSLLKHRVTDSYDWWADPMEELAEINQGNILFIGLTEDGAYELEIIKGAPLGLLNQQQGYDSVLDKSQVQAFLRNSSGHFYIGPGETVVNDTDVNKTKVAGYFIDVDPGNYQVTISSVGNKIQVQLHATEQNAVNHFEESLILHDGETDYLEFLNTADMSNLIDLICDHLEDIGYVWEESEGEDEIVFYHEQFGYLMIEEYDGGARLYTAVEYDRVDEMDEGVQQEWQLKLYMVLDYFNASATVARAYNDPDENQVIIDVWYPGAYNQQAFEVFLGHWHEDITTQLDEAESDIFGAHKLH